MSRKKKEALPGAVPPRCGLCGQLFPHRDLLDEHCRSHIDTEAIVCALCDRIYLKFIHFKRHFKVHHTDCENIIATPDTESVEEIEDGGVSEELVKSARTSSIGDVVSTQLNPHDTAAEIEAYVQVCGLCGEVMLSPELLTEHNNTQHHDLKIRCYLCAKKFNNVYSRRDHMERCRLVETPHQCATCEERFSSEERLCAHARCRHGRDAYRAVLAKLRTQTSYVCHYCGSVFVSKESFRSHKYCGPLEDCVCDICNKKFDRKGKLLRHMKSHSVEKKLVLCQYCGSQYKSNNHLKAHIRSRHTGEKPFECLVCGRCFTFHQTYRNHMIMHNNIYNYPCSYCDRKFRRKAVRDRHTMTHTGERPHRCAQCGVGFIQKHCLTKHMEKHAQLADANLGAEAEGSKSDDCVGVEMYTDVYSKTYTNRKRARRAPHKDQ